MFKMRPLAAFYSLGCLFLDLIQEFEEYIITKWRKELFKNIVIVVVFLKRIIRNSNNVKKTKLLTNFKEKFFKWNSIQVLICIMGKLHGKGHR